MVCYLKEGMKNNVYVGKVQNLLQKKGYYLKGKVDNWFGPYMADEVGRFQKAQKIEVDECIGCQSWKKLTTTQCPWDKTIPQPPSKWYMDAGGMHDQQDESFSCGPASISRLLDEQGRKIAESKLIELFHTSESGTGHGNIKIGLSKVGFRVEEVKAQDMPIQKLADITQSNRMGAILHAQLKFVTDKAKTMVYDANGKLVWSKFRGGHYIYVKGVNPVDKLVIVDDPTKEIVYYKTSQIYAAAQYTEQKLGIPGFLVIAPA